MFGYQLEAAGQVACHPSDGVKPTSRAFRRQQSYTSFLDIRMHILAVFRNAE
jgi:hypothetical protein